MESSTTRWLWPKQRPGIASLECADLERHRVGRAFRRPAATISSSAPTSWSICAEPGALLAQLPDLLAPNGRVLLSVPNAAYAGLIAELLAGDFRYRPEGLLDETHCGFSPALLCCRLLEEHGLRVGRVGCHGRGSGSI
jgi:hypothetical protein